MNVSYSFRAFARRWYIVVPALILAVAVALSLWINVKPGFERSATQVLLPASTDIPDDANPFLYLGGLGQAADVVVRAVSAESVTSTITEGYDGVEVRIARDTSSGAPVIVTTVTAESDDDTAEVLEAFVRETGQRLDAIQADSDVPPEGRIGIKTLSIDETSRIDQKNRLTVTAVSGVAILVGGLVLAAVLDGMLMSRSRRPGRVGAAQEPEAAEESRPPDDDDLDVEPAVPSPPLRRKTVAKPTGADPSDDATGADLSEVKAG